MFAFFADLKAAFDRVDREKMREIMRKAEIGKTLRRRIMETYEETKSIIKLDNKKNKR